MLRRALVAAALCAAIGSAPRPAVAQTPPPAPALPVAFQPPPGWLPFPAISNGAAIVGAWTPPAAGAADITIVSIGYTGTVDELIRDNIHKFTDPTASFNPVGAPIRSVQCGSTPAITLTLESVKLKRPERQIQTYIIAGGTAYSASYTYLAAAEDPAVTAAARAALASLCRLPSSKAS